MSKLIALIHATKNSFKPVNDAFSKIAPEHESLNLLDEGLIHQVNKEGKVSPETLRRFIDLLNKAEASGVDGILAVCSVFTPYQSIFTDLTEKPFVNADLAMLKKALEYGDKIGLIATVEGAAHTSKEILQSLAMQEDRKIEVLTRILPEAFIALGKNDLETHDKLIQNEMNNLDGSCDVIVLAQVSIVRAYENSQQDLNVPVLTSLESSIREILNKTE